MNNNLEKIMKIADSVGLNEAASAASSAIDKVNSRSKLHVALVGGQNSGKTTIINAIAGKEVREASNISLDDEFPLRITFERTDEDFRFECVDVYDKVWNEENAIIFEFKVTDLVENGKRTEFADDVDVVFYLISAMNAFTSEDVSALKALASHNVKLILTKLDAIDEEDRDGVIKYVSDMCAKLGFTEPLVIDRSNLKDAGKLIRNALPLYTEQKEQREKYCDMLLGELTAAVKEKIGAKLSELDERLPATDDFDSRRETNSKALEAKNNLMELGIARSKKFEDDNNKLANTLAKKILESGKSHSFSDAWKMSIQQEIVEPVIAAEFEAENELIKKHLFEDSTGINPTEEESRNLKNKINETLKNSAQISEITDYNAELAKGTGTVNYTKICIAAAVVAGAILFPMPTLPKWLVSVGAVGVGAGSVYAEIKTTEKAMWENNIKEYSKLISKRFYDGMKIYNNYAYEQLADYVNDTILNEGSDIVEQRRKAVDAEKEMYRKMLDELE